jgi:HK97 gp10 family phage protein
MAIQNIEIIGRFTGLTNEQLYAILEEEAKGLVRDLKASISRVGIRDSANRLSDSIKYEKTGDLEIRIFADEEDAPYFKYLEYGTRPHEIKTRYRQALKFNIGEDTIFAKKVMHPGTKAYAPFETAVERNREGIIRRVQSLSDLTPEQEDTE